MNKDEQEENNPTMSKDEQEENNPTMNKDEQEEKKSNHELGWAGGK